MISSMMLWRFYVRCMGLEKRITEVLMIPGIILCESKNNIDVLPITHVALELHISRTNYQSDHVIMDLENKPTETIDCGTKKVHTD